MSAKDEVDEVITPTLTPEEVHDKTIHDLENEEVKKDGAEDEDNQDDQDDTKGKEDEDKDGSGDDAGDDAGDDDDDKGDGSEDDQDDEDASSAPKPSPKSKTPEIDTDTSNNVEGKVAIKDSEGNTAYFNSLEEVPDDFEPASYKELMRSVSLLNKKEAKDEAVAQEAELEAVNKKSQEDIDAVIKSWDADVAVLTKAGILSDDDALREVEVADTYAYIGKKLSDGISMDSFAEAHKAMKFDQLQEATAADKKKKSDNKKKQGSMVMGGGGATSGKKEGGSREIEAPPPGIGLDAVHAKYSGLR